MSPRYWGWTTLCRISMSDLSLIIGSTHLADKRCVNRTLRSGKFTRILTVHAQYEGIGDS